ncbi:ComEC/Rec2 family competence protein [Clostridium carnis]
MKKKVSFILLSVLMIILVGCTNSKDSNLNENLFLVHYIDVGQGDAILIQVNNKNMLIDSGPKSEKDKLFSYLNSLKIKNLDYVIATHPHEDHIGNMADIISKYNITNFYAPKVTSNTKAFERMVEELISKNLNIKVIKASISSIDLGSKTNVEVFSPNSSDYGDNLNNFSPIIKITFGENSFLFTGDAEKKSEDEVLKNNYDLNCDVLKIGHHGSTTSTSKNFLKAISPTYAIISVGKDNTYNHPNKKITSLLDENNITTYRTDIEGNIILVSDGKEIYKK